MNPVQPAADVLSWTARRTPAIRPLPPLWKEARVPLELGRLLVDPVFRGEGVVAGDGQPVILVAGFLAGDPSLDTMAGWLKRMGHRPSRAGFRWNVGCSGASVDRLEVRARALAEKYGRKVAVIGQSRGGTFARALAVRRPDLVDRVVTLGSPIADPLDIHPAVWAQVQVVGLLGTLGAPGMLKAACWAGPCCADFNRETRTPFPAEVALTSIASRSDGIVRFRATQDPAATSVEVRSSHIGMAVSPEVYRAIGAALAPEAVPAAVAQAA